MVDQQVTTFFNKMYDETYLRVLKYVTIKCSSPEDIADIVQEVFVEAYAVLVKKGVSYIDNENAFMIQLAKSKIYRHYTLAQKLKNMLPLSKYSDSDAEVCVDNMEANIEYQSVEEQVINKDTVDIIWQEIKEKPMDVQKIFYLYYYFDMPLKEIAAELKISESNVKHKLYRTLGQIRSFYKKGGEAL